MSGPAAPGPRVEILDAPGDEGAPVSLSANEASAYQRNVLDGGGQDATSDIAGQVSDEAAINLATGGLDASPETANALTSVLNIGGESSSRSDGGAPAGSTGGNAGGTAPTAGGESPAASNVVRRVRRVINPTRMAGGGSSGGGGLSTGILVAIAAVVGLIVLRGTD